MTKGEYSYPPDEFDAVDPSVGPRGVHRKPRSRWATTWPFLAALLAAAAVGLAVVHLVWDGEGPLAQVAGVEQPTAAPVSPGATAASQGSVDEPSGAPGAPAPDLDAPVRVVNATSVTGLASDAAERLRDAGWTAVVTGNYAGPALTSSTVTYADADLEASARAVAEALDIATVERMSSEGRVGIEVVLESDFAS